MINNTDIDFLPEENLPTPIPTPIGQEEQPSSENEEEEDS
jgi:hypothetical protein